MNTVVIDESRRRLLTWQPSAPRATHLYLYDNQRSQAPGEIGLLRELRVLDLASNLLSAYHRK
ncbi:MAG: hypothetical protein ACR2M5_07670 [Nakamurella sp.]